MVFTTTLYSTFKYHYFSADYFLNLFLYRPDYFSATLHIVIIVFPLLLVHLS